MLSYDKNKPRVSLIVGTRPELIKIAPLIEKLKDENFRQIIEVDLISSGQQRDLLQDALKSVNFKFDIDLKLMMENQTSLDFFLLALTEFNRIFSFKKYSMIIVHGDTATATAAAIAAHHHKIQVAHVEAGLRSGDLWAPWPEESNRRIIDSISSLHFAPTTTALQNLISEGHMDTSHVTGNTVVDAVKLTVNRINSGDLIPDKSLVKFIDSTNKPLVLVTLHRRENFGERLESILEKIIKLSRMNLCFVLPVHPNPNVSEVVRRKLGNLPNVQLIQPLSYTNMIYLLTKVRIIITDSGGLQEEGPSLGIPVLVTRDKTERVEAVAAGSVKLVGSHGESLVSDFEELFIDETAYSLMANSQNPYGDGAASQQIVELIQQYLGLDK